MAWKGTKTELMTFIKELNKKCKIIKFDFQISLKKFISWRNAYPNPIHTTLYRKPTDDRYTYSLNQNTENL